MPKVQDHPLPPSAQHEKPPPALSGWERASFGAARACVRGMAAVLGLRGLYVFGRAFGTLEWMINYKRRRRFAARMKEIFGSAKAPQARGACRRYFMRTRCDKLFYLILDTLPRDLLAQHLEVRNWSAVETALRLRRGVYVALSHFGAHHNVAILLALRGVKVAGVRDPNEGAWYRFMRMKFSQRLPEIDNIRMFHSGTFPRDIFRCLQANFVLGSALDVQRRRQDHLRTLPVRMFGSDREILAGPLQLALRCRSPILTAFMVSLPNFHYRLDFLGPLADSDQAREDDATLSKVAQIYAGHVENHMRIMPCHVSRI